MRAATSQTVRRFRSQTVRRFRRKTRPPQRRTGPLYPGREGAKLFLALGLEGGVVINAFVKDALGVGLV
jgi:hypothetical protein